MSPSSARRAEIARRVLIVEDEAMVAMLVEFTLQNADCVVVGPVSSVRGALRLIEDHGLDAAVVDFRLGDDNSSEIMDVLDQRGVPFLLMTGQAIDDLPPRLRRLNFLAKPFQPEDLVRAVEEILSAQGRWATSSECTASVAFDKQDGLVVPF
jgi:DNA-binding NtrC family response regulator